MKRLLLAFLFFSSNTNSFSQGVWTDMPNMVGTYGRYGSVGFSIGGYGYVCSGEVNSVLANDLWKYDPVMDAWSQQANYPGTAALGQFSFSLNGKGYVGGGQYGTSYTSSVCEYDPGSNQWVQKAASAAAQRYFCSYFTIANKGYVALGEGPNGLLSDIYEYDPTNDSWVQRANFPGTVRYGPGGFSVNGKGYCVAGSYSKASGLYYFDLWQFDPVANSWIQKSNFPGLGKKETASFAINGLGYVISRNAQTDCWSYDPVTDSWAMIAGHYGLFGAASFVAAGKGYVVGGLGYDQSSSFTMNTVSQYDPNGVGIGDDKTLDVNISIYPNPASDFIAIDVQSEQQMSLKVYDSQGKEVFEQVLYKRIELNTANLPRGAYLLRVSNSDQSAFATRKLILL